MNTLRYHVSTDESFIVISPIARIREAQLHIDEFFLPPVSLGHDYKSGDVVTLSNVRTLIRVAVLNDNPDAGEGSSRVGGGPYCYYFVVRVRISTARMSVLDLNRKFVKTIVLCRGEM